MCLFEYSNLSHPSKKLSKQNDLTLIIPIPSEVKFTNWRSNNFPTMNAKEESLIEKCYSRKNYLLCLCKTKNLRTPVNNQTFLG